MIGVPKTVSYLQTAWEELVYHIPSCQGPVYL